MVMGSFSFSRYFPFVLFNFGKDARYPIVPAPLLPETPLIFKHAYKNFVDTTPG
jgi:hypothetical protein